MELVIGGYEDDWGKAVGKFGEVEVFGGAGGGEFGAGRLDLVFFHQPDDGRVKKQPVQDAEWAAGVLFEALAEGPELGCERRLAPDEDQVAIDPHAF